MLGEGLVPSACRLRWKRDPEFPPFLPEILELAWHDSAGCGLSLDAVLPAGPPPTEIGDSEMWLSTAIFHPPKARN